MTFPPRFKNVADLEKDLDKARRKNDDLRAKVKKLKRKVRKLEERLRETPTHAVGAAMPEDDETGIFDHGHVNCRCRVYRMEEAAQ